VSSALETCPEYARSPLPTTLHCGASFAGWPVDTICHRHAAGSPPVLKHKACIQGGPQPRSDPATTAPTTFCLLHTIAPRPIAKMRVLLSRHRATHPYASPPTRGRSHDHHSALIPWICGQPCCAGFPPLRCAQSCARPVDNPTGCPPPGTQVGGCPQAPPGPKSISNKNPNPTSQAPRCARNRVTSWDYSY